MENEALRCEKRRGIFEYVDKQRLVSCFIFTFAIGLVAHAYAFLNFQPSHDSLYEVVSDAAYWKWKLQLGRFLKPLYDLALGRFASLPWINGLMSLLWLSLAGYLVTEMLRINKRPGIALTCGVLSVNLTVMALAATYMPDLSSDMLALLFVLLGCRIWYGMTDGKTQLAPAKKLALTLCAGLCVGVSLGIYQALVCVFVTMVLAVSVMRLLDEKTSWIRVWLSDFWAAGIALLGGGVYYGGLRLALAATGTELAQDYNGLTNLFGDSAPISEQLSETLRWVKVYLTEFSGHAHSVYFTSAVGILTVALATVCFVWLAGLLIKRKASAGNVITALLLFAAIPFAMNLMRLLSSCIHLLMFYAFWLAYIIAYVLAGELSARKNTAVFERAAALLLCCVIFINVQTANAVYVKKTTEQQATLSVMTRVVDRVETQPGYERGVTPVAFIGIPQAYFSDFAPYDKIGRLTGTDTSGSITYYSIYGVYIPMMLRTDMNIADRSVAAELAVSEEVAAMPAFPAVGSVNTVEGVVVVKFA